MRAIEHAGETGRGAAGPLRRINVVLVALVLLVGQVSAASCITDIHPQRPHVSQTHRDDAHGPGAVMGCDQSVLSALVTSRAPDRDPNQPALPVTVDATSTAPARESTHLGSTTATPSNSVPTYLRTARLRL